MTDKDQMSVFGLNGDHDLPERFGAFDGFALVEDRPPALAPSLVSLGFIRAALRRTARFWCALAVVGLVVGVGVNMKYPYAYKASTSVLLTYGPDENPTSAVIDNQAIAESRSVAAIAVRKLGLQEPPGSFAASVTANVVTTRVLDIIVSAPSSAQAVSRANAVAAAFLQFRAEEMQAAQQMLLRSLNQDLTQARQAEKAIDSQVSQASAQSASPAQSSQLKNLKDQATQAAYQVSIDQQAIAGTRANTATLTAVKGSVVLDPAAPLAHSKLKYLVIYAVTGLVAGLVLGMGLVIVQTIVSDKLRRRDDVTHALEAPVKLSVGEVRLSRWRPGRRGMAAAGDIGVRRIVAHLRGTVPPSGRGAALAIVPVDDSGVAALSLASLAVSCAQDGKKVLLADLASGAPAAALLESKAPGVRSVSVDGAQLTLAVPGDAAISPVGPLGAPPAEDPDPDFTAAVASAYRSADLLLTLATLDPSLSGDYLATWAASAVVVVTAGRSSWAKIHAAGEMIRLAGVSLASGVIIGADKTDDSLGMTETSGAFAGPDGLA